MSLCRGDANCPRVRLPRGQFASRREQIVVCSRWLRAVASTSSRFSLAQVSTEKGEHIRLPGGNPQMHEVMTLFGRLTHGRVYPELMRPAEPVQLCRQLFRRVEREVVCSTDNERSSRHALLRRGESGAQLR